MTAAKAYRDAPISSKDSDVLGIYKSAQAMTDFIKRAQTPLTISIQGSWGSGKTSFMNMVQSILKNDKGYKTINIQSWDYFIYSDGNVGTQAIVASILNSLEQETGVKEKLSSTARSAQNFFAKGLGMLASLQGGNGETILKTLSDEPNTTKYLRDLVKSIVQKSPDTTFVFFIDDLDRIDPKVAVETLDILRSIFFVEQCIFIIAIDADVVTKGLSSKYRTSTLDKHVSQDYFDKIFQLTYHIPTNKDSVIDYLWLGLKDIGIFTNDDDKFVIDQAIKISSSLLKNNPRKIKRLIIHMSYRIAFDSYNNDHLMKGSVYLRSIATILAALEIAQADFIKHLGLYPDFTHPTTNSMASLIDVRSLHKIPELESWDAWYRSVLLESEYSQDTDNIVAALQTINIFLQKDRHLDLVTILGLSSFVDYSNGDVSITEVDFEENVETSYIYGIRLIQDMQFKPNSTIIHLGCQDGLVTKEFLSKHNVSFVYAVEMQKSLAAAARNTLEGSGYDKERYKVSYCQIENINEREAYDFAFSVTAAHWIKTPVYVKAYQALKPGGMLYFEQSGLGTYEAMLEVLERTVRKLIQGDRGDISNIDPFYMPTPDELQKLLSEIGFIDIKIESEIDTGTAYGQLYEDYISTNALPYIENLTKDEQSKVREEFLRTCREENTDKSANILWIKAKKPEVTSITDF